MDIEKGITHYDIIGDIHGHARELRQLLEKLGYKRDKGAYKPPTGHKAIFVGDYIDRESIDPRHIIGQSDFEAIHIVSSMAEAGYAHAIMGNHELKAALDQTHYEDHNGAWVRPSDKILDTGSSYKAGAPQFDPHALDEQSAWIKSLPLWLEIGDLRVVHAQWDQKSMDYLHEQGMLDEHNAVKPENWQQFIYSSALYKAITMLTKGMRIALGNASFEENGKLRRNARIKWFGVNPDDPDLTMDQIVLGVPLGHIAQASVPHEIRRQIRAAQRSYGKGSEEHGRQKTLFFGHYWQKKISDEQFEPIIGSVWTPPVKPGDAICIDWSIAEGGHLAAATVEMNEGRIKDIKLESVPVHSLYQDLTARERVARDRDGIHPFRWPIGRM